MTKTATAIIPKDHEMLKNSSQAPTKPQIGPRIRDMTTYPPPDLGIAADRTAIARTDSRMAIPPMMNAITMG